MPYTWLGKFLHDLKEAPAWLVLCIIFTMVWAQYVTTGDQFTQRVVDTILGALVGVLIGRVKDVVMDRRAATTVTGDINVEPKPKEEEEQIEE